MYFFVVHLVYRVLFLQKKIKKGVDVEDRHT